MPYNPGGIFNLVQSYFASPGTTIRTEQHNPVFEDVQSALSQVLIRDGRAPMTGPLNMNSFPINNVAAGTSPGSVATLAQAMPIGAVIDFAGPDAPAGWMFAYGQAISRTTYAALYTAIGTYYGAGDGSTTFQLPDLRGRVVAGRDNMGGVSATRITTQYSGINGTQLSASGGSEVHTLTQPQLPAIQPIFDGIQDQVSVSSTATDWMRNPVNIGVTGSSTTIQRNADAARVDSTGNFTPRGTIRALGSNTPHNNTQPTIILNKIIRVSYDG